MEDKGGQWAILPAAVRYDRGLPANAKLLYAEIAAKINAEGYCYASNRFFAELLQLKEDTVSGLVRRLADSEYIRLDLVQERSNRDKRRIYLTGKPYDFAGSLGFKSGPGKISEAAPDLNPGVIENREVKTNPPKAPQGGGREKKCAGWQPERFELFWSAFPRGEAKEKARRAWDKLKPDEATMRAMAIGLKRQLKSEDWQRGIGIPYAATWINQRRWEDEQRTPPPIASQSGWAETGEVF